MNDAQKLKKMNRMDLVNLLSELIEENESLKSSNEQLVSQLRFRKIVVKDAGSIAEASLRLNKVFETAQAACDDYLESVKFANEKSEKIITDAKEEAAKILADASENSAKTTADANEKAQKIIAEAEAEAARIIALANQRLEEVESKWASALAEAELSGKKADPPGEDSDADRTPQFPIVF